MQYWPFEDPFYPEQSMTGGPLDQSVTFQPDSGPPIIRRRTTATVEMLSLSVVFDDRDEAQPAFESWFQDDLKGGTLPFAWRHPRIKDVRSFRFSPATYDLSYPGGSLMRVSFGAMILPGKLWFAQYVPPETARVPYFVADYAADRYWIDQTPVPATLLTIISGDYLVYTQRATYTRTISTETYLADVPQTAPAGVDWIAGFKL